MKGVKEWRGEKGRGEERKGVKEVRGEGRKVEGEKKDGDEMRNKGDSNYDRRGSTSYSVKGKACLLVPRDLD